RQLAEDLGTPHSEARALAGLADAEFFRGRMLSAKRYYHRCIVLCTEHGFDDLTIANLASLGFLHQFENSLSLGVDECERAAAMATRRGHRRAELLARGVCVSWLLIEMGQLDRAEGELRRGLDICRTEDLLRFEPDMEAALSRIAFLRGDLATAEVLARSSLAHIRERGLMASSGPIALACLAMITGDNAERARALSDGRAALERRCLGHNYLYFFRDAIEVSLRQGELDQALAYADALDRHTCAEPLPWADLHGRRARHLVAYLREGPSAERTTALGQLRDRFESAGLRISARALARAAAGRSPYPPVGKEVLGAPERPVQPS
ncbi:MAG: hypothetical protein AAGC55_34410, partial [Myxococcota bacterium]